MTLWGRFARLRLRLTVSSLLWASWIVYTSVVVALVDLWRRGAFTLGCIRGDSYSSYDDEWRWWPVGWQCDYTPVGGDAVGPGWSLTVAIALIPIGLVILTATRALAKRWLRSQQPEEGGQPYGGPW